MYTYDNALHGFSVVLAPNELEAIKKFPGLILAYNDKIVTFETTDTTKFLSLRAFVGLWNTSNFGQHIIIGVIDRGLWLSMLLNLFLSKLRSRTRGMQPIRQLAKIDPTQPNSPVWVGF